jgi:hypothetical protein
MPVGLPQNIHEAVDANKQEGGDVPMPGKDVTRLSHPEFSDGCHERKSTLIP